MDRLVSVVIPTYNRQMLTDMAIESVVCSNPDLVEIVVVDDCGQIPYVRENLKNAHGIVISVTRLEVNVGAGIARSYGVKRSRGEFIAFLDSDDLFDSAWLDHVIELCLAASGADEHYLFCAGQVEGGSLINRTVRRILVALPSFAQMPAVRALLIFFNPFYTPSVVAHRDLCFFKDDLRHCEDYFTNFLAVFRATRIVLPDVNACYLGRRPGSAGGLSASGIEMIVGEMATRFFMLGSQFVPIKYKFLVPAGMIYQILRLFFKFTANACSSFISYVRSLRMDKG